MRASGSSVWGRRGNIKKTIRNNGREGKKDITGSERHNFLRGILKNYTLQTRYQTPKEDSER